VAIRFLGRPFSEVIRIRDHAPPVRSREQLVARPGVSNHVPVRVERIPVCGCEDGVLAELASLKFDPRPVLNARRKAVGPDCRSEVISHAVAVSQIASPLRTARNGQ
jgi:hypothetical protein